MARWLTLLIVLVCPARILPEGTKKPKPEPVTTSIYPASVTRGAYSGAEIRGTTLAGARALVFDNAGVTAEIQSTENKPEGAGPVHVELRVTPDAPLGWHSFRVVTAAGVTNALRVMVVDEPAINGRILKAGDVGTHWINPKPGETLTIEAISGYAAFDPAVTLFEETGSWFDPHRLDRIAFNDDPLSFPELSTDARLVYRFTHAGKYCLQIGSSDGKGGPDYSYVLRITHGAAAAPPLHPELKAAWDERQFTRVLSKNRLSELNRRGGQEDALAIPEVYRAVPEDSGEIPAVTPPAIVEGRIGRPGETQLIRIKIDKPQDLAIEVETPRATLPRFNPVVRLMQPDDYEIATDVYAKLNNNGLYMMKMIEAKTAFSLRSPGEYTLRVRDITTGCAGEDFVYRVLVRQQIPHVGAVEIAADHINLEPGGVKPVAIKVDREEGFSGYVVVNVRNLPAGVTAVQAMENPEEKPPLPNGGRAERYFAKDQATSVILTAAANAPVTPMPGNARVEISVVNGDKMGTVIASREIPVMVVEHRP